MLERRIRDAAEAIADQMHLLERPTVHITGDRVPAIGVEREQIEQLLARLAPRQPPKSHAPDDGGRDDQTNEERQWSHSTIHHDCTLPSNS